MNSSIEHNNQSILVRPRHIPLFRISMCTLVEKQINHSTWYLYRVAENWSKVKLIQNAFSAGFASHCQACDS